jgi:hypothetical protein
MLVPGQVCFRVAGISVVNPRMAGVRVGIGARVAGMGIGVNARVVGIGVGVIARMTFWGWYWWQVYQC